MYLQGVRGKINQNIEINKINHELLLLKSEEKLKLKDSEIKQLKELNAKKDEKLNEMNKKIEQNGDEINNLKKFAERISKLHLTLSDKYIQANDHRTLFHEDYEEKVEIYDWNKIVGEVNEDENVCGYLETLKESINQYKKIIYCPTYEDRILNFCFLTPPGVFRGGFVKIPCLLTTECIQIEQFHDFNDFLHHSVGKISFQNFGEVYSYYVAGCLHVVVNKRFRRDVYLLHFSAENGSIPLPNKETAKIDNIWEYMYDRSIILYFDYEEEKL